MAQPSPTNVVNPGLFQPMLANQIAKNKHQPKPNHPLLQFLIILTYQKQNNLQNPYGTNTVRSSASSLSASTAWGSQQVLVKRALFGEFGAKS